MHTSVVGGRTDDLLVFFSVLGALGRGNLSHCRNWENNSERGGGWSVSTEQCIVPL